MSESRPGPVEQPAEQLLYAKLLDWGTRVGMVALVLSFGAYVLGLVRPHVPLEQLAQAWSHPVGTYLQETASPTGWGWLALVQRGDKAFAALCLAEVAVVVLAASGWLSGGH